MGDHLQLPEIQAEWERDTQIDETRLDAESLRIPQLHSKYFKMFSEERLRLRLIESENKRLRLEKMNFYLDGPTEEQHKNGWVLPPKGKIIRADVQSYLDADPDLVKHSHGLNYQKEKVEVLESIIDNLNRRSFLIKNAIEWQRFINGG